MNPVFIKATTLSDAWFQTLYACVDVGNKFKIDRGSYAGQERLEFDYITIQIKYPNVRPLLPKISERYGIPDPVDEDYLDAYLPYLMTGEIAEGESYTYGSRMTKNKLMNGESTKRFLTQWKNIYIQDDIGHAISNEHASNFLSQLDLLIWTYKNKGYRNNQMCLQVAEPNDMLLKDPPCLRLIDTRIQNNKLHFFPYFRSWDLYGGFPANLAAIQLMKEYVASEIGVEDGEIIASSKGLHVYDYVYDIVDTLRGK